MSLHYMHTISCNGRFYVTYILSQFKKKKRNREMYTLLLKQNLQIWNHFISLLTSPCGGKRFSWLSRSHWLGKKGLRREPLSLQTATRVERAHSHREMFRKNQIQWHNVCTWSHWKSSCSEANGHRRGAMTRSSFIS